MNYEFTRDNPGLEKIVFLLTLDRKKLTERIIIGETSEVRLRIERNIGDVFFDETRPLGRLMIDFETDPNREWNVNIARMYENGFKMSLSSKTIPKAVKPCVDFLRRKYESGESSAMFAAIRIWEDFTKCYNMNHGADIFMERAVSLCKPFSISDGYNLWESEAVRDLSNITRIEEAKSSCGIRLKSVRSSVSPSIRRSSR